MNHFLWKPAIGRPGYESRMESKMVTRPVWTSAVEDGSEAMWSTGSDIHSGLDKYSLPSWVQALS